MEGKNKVDRTEKLNSEFLREISEIIRRKLKNPNITAMVSVTAVDTAKDLKSAKVYVSVYSTDEGKINQTFEALKEEAKKIRYELAQKERIRTVPELRFILDQSFSYGAKMDKLFSEINKGQNK